MQILIVEKNKRTICSCLTYSALMYILKVKPLKYLSVNHSLYYHRWFDMQCILKLGNNVLAGMPEYVFGMQLS